MCSNKKTQGKSNILTVVKDYSIFFTKLYYERTKGMMREIEKVFENMKEEFNRKILTDSFMSYFVKENDAGEGGLSSDSFEDITMDTHMSPNTVDEKHSIDPGSVSVESPDQNPDPICVDSNDDICVGNIKNQPIIIDGEEITEVLSKLDVDVDVIDEIKYHHHDDDIAEIAPEIQDNRHNDEIAEVANEKDEEPNDEDIVKENEEILPEDVNEKCVKIVSGEDVDNDDTNLNVETTVLVRICTSDRPLNVIDEEDTAEEIGVIIEDINDKLIPVDNDTCILLHIGDGINGDLDNDLLNKKCEDSSELYVEILTEEEFNATDKTSINKSIYGHKMESINEFFTNDIGEPEESDESDTENKISNANITVDCRPTSYVQDNVDSIPTETILDNEIKSSPKPLNDLEVPLTPGIVKKQSLQRMMWSEMPEVIASGILQTLPKKQIQLQEAMFEIITSEVSYYQSLMILTTHFFESLPFKITEDKECLLSNTDRHHIFSNIILITNTSLKFSNDLDQRWREQKPLLKEICDIILAHATSEDFQNYVTYLRNQEYQSKALKRLAENEVFKQQLNKLEMSSVCGKLSMDSYLMLPMQRLTRLKLLVDTLLKVMYCEELKDFIQEDHINTAEMASLKLKMLLDTSDSEKGIMDQKSMLLILMNKMEFPPNFKRIPLSNKTFIKEDEVRVHQQNPMKYIKKFSKKRQPIISLILFNDLLIVAKTKNSRLLVIDYCERTNLEVTETKYKSIVSSADVSNSACVEFDDEPEDANKTSLNSLVRSKSSLPPEELKRLSSSFTSSFRSLSLVNRIDEQEIINTSFSVKFLKSQTDIFSVPIALLAKNKMDRDEWMTLLKNCNATDGRLHKTTSLKHSAITKEDFGINKNQSCYTKRKDD